MKSEYVMERTRARVVELFQREGGEDVERVRLPLGDLVREGARLMLETALEMEVEEFLGRGRYQRGDRKRVGYRNGSAERTVKTLAGEVTVRKPKVSDTEEEFHSEILRAWQRRCDEMSALIPGLYLEGLSTRDFKRVLKTFWGEAGLSRSVVSRLNKRLHEEFEQWRKRDLSKEGLVFLFLDGYYAGVRFGTSEKEAVLVAHGIRPDGSRSFLGLTFGGRESTSSWSELLHDLVARNLPEPKLVVSDGNKGLIAALKAIWPDVPRQRCVVHRTGNILEKVPKSAQGEIRKALNAIWYAKDLEEAKRAASAFVKKYGKRYEAATDCLLDALPECLTFYRLPEDQWRRLRTSNLLERTFKEVRRRTRVVGRFPTESSALAVIYGILAMESAKWRGLRFGGEDAVNIEKAAKALRSKPIILDIQRKAA